MKDQHTLKWPRLAAALLACLVWPVHSETVSTGAAQARTEAQFRQIRSQPPLLWAFLKDMPKGGDLHSHLSGAIYAESMIDWAAEDGLCVDTKTLVVRRPPCDEAAGQVLAKKAHTDPLLYRRMIDAWSMRNASTAPLSGHDQFFDSFGKFGAANKGRDGDMLAEVTARAKAGHVSYLELMLTPASAETSKTAAKVGWTDDFSKMRTALFDNGLPEAVQAAAKDLASVSAKQRERQAA